MPNIFIIHGKENSPEGNWFPWLKEELEKLGHKVFVPKFPTPANQTLAEWLKVFAAYQDEITPETIVIGHSLGVPFLLSVLEQFPVKAAFFVAGFINNPPDKSAQTFCKPFNWERIKKNCRSFYVFYSDNDPYFDVKKGQALGQNLDAEVIFIKGAGHFNKAAGYLQFPLLLEKIKTCQEMT